MAVGAYTGQGGGVKTYRLNGNSGAWEIEQDIIPPGLTSHDSFGHSVELHYNAIEDQWLLAVGSQSRNTSQPDTGMAYIYVLDPVRGWELQAEVLPDALVPYGWFGTKVTWATAGERNFLIVGAPGSDTLGVIGSVYVFERGRQGTWTQQAHLQASDGTPEDAFGLGLAAAESQGATVLAVGASGHVNLPLRQPGAAYFYRFDQPNETWVLEAQFEAHVPTAQDQFGKDVDVCGVSDPSGFTHRAAVGCPNEGGGGASSGPGGVYLYLRSSDGVWQEEAHLDPPVQNDPTFTFGTTVHIDPERPSRLLAGTPNSREFHRPAGNSESHLAAHMCMIAT